MSSFVEKMADVTACVHRKPQTIAEICEVTKVCRPAVTGYLKALWAEGLVEPVVGSTPDTYGRSHVWMWVA